MSTATVPPNKEFTAIWTAYALFGLATLLWWPALLALVICYTKRNAPAGGFIGSHHRWLIHSFWWSLLGYVFSVAAMGVGLAPLIGDVMRSAGRGGAGDWHRGQAIDIDWSSIFATVGGASVGALGLLAVWLWFVYRVIRGIVRLSDAQPAP
jgi:uncharacterized membrane protein